MSIVRTVGPFAEVASAYVLPNQAADRAVAVAVARSLVSANGAGR